MHPRIGVLQTPALLLGYLAKRRKHFTNYTTLNQDVSTHSLINKWVEIIKLPHNDDVFLTNVQFLN